MQPASLWPLPAEHVPTSANYTSKHIALLEWRRLASTDGYENSSIRSNENDW
jgi:hypothetical protein